MNRSTGLPCFLVLLLCVGSAHATTLEAQVDNNLYLRDNLIDTSAAYAQYAGGLSADLREIGSTKLSVSADAGFANTFSDTTHKRFEIWSLSLDAPVVQGLQARLGRQRVYSLLTKSAYIDGLKLGYDIGGRARVHALAGMPVPSRYSAKMVQTDAALIKAEGGVEVKVFRDLWVGLQAGRWKDSTGLVLMPIDLSLDGRVIPQMRIRSDVAYDAAARRLDNYSVELSGTPTRSLDLSVHARGEDEAFDSTSAYERLVLGRYDEAGVRAAYAFALGAVSGYYTYRSVTSGSDNIGGISGGAMGIHLGIEAGNGVNGSSAKATLGVSHTYWDVLKVGASGAFYTFKLPANNSREESLYAKAYVRWLLPTVGITVAPEVQYLRNEYYRNDVRFLLNAQYRFQSFWKS